MGAGGKADPTRLRIAALADCINDPLASKIKWKLKKHEVDPEKVMSIFSVEKPMCDLLPLEEEQKNNPQVSDLRSCCSKRIILSIKMNTCLCVSSYSLLNDSVHCLSNQSSYFLSSPPNRIMALWTIFV